MESDSVTRVGVVLPTRGVLISGETNDVGQVLDMAARAEQIGVDGAWVGDSLTAKPRLEPLSVLMAVAARTRTIGLGTSVLLAPLRHPVLLAQTTATLNLLSGGRLTLGMGVGGAFNEAQKGEWRAAGIDPRHRGSRLAEIADVLPRLWSGGPVSFAGRNFCFEDVSIGYAAGDGVHVPRPRILLACHHGEGRERQYERAARFADGLISITDSPEEFAGVRSQVLDIRSRLIRPADDFHSTFYMTVNLNPDEAAAAAESDAWIRAYYGVNFWGDRWGPFGDPDRVVERARAYVAAGADEIVFRFAANDQSAQLELYGERILPALK
jgi:alkanesulfonate monooxygenase SsuD/methylene tetrahydromethanopterin reductase-like flavin-dependent oxidoreductase (luciferase family)